MKKYALVGAFLSLVMSVQAIPTPVHAYGEGVPVLFGVTGFGGHGGGGQRTTVTTASTGTQTTNGTQGQVLGASAYNFSSHLGWGSKGQDVTELQKILISLGYLKIASATGWYGPLTTAAVKQYQTAKGIAMVGEVGPLTRAALNRGALPANDSMVSKTWVEQKVDTVAKTVQSVLDWSAST